MKKIVVIVLLVLVAVGMFAGGAITGNGYDWITFSIGEKTMLTIGILAGISYANTVLIGYDADNLVLLTPLDILFIIKKLDKFYEDESIRIRSTTIVVSIVAALNILRGG